MSKVQRIEIPLNDLIRYCSLMSAGKLIGGLLHNINGPLHTLGIEIDVLNHIVLKTQANKPDFLQNLATRFSRMEEEFESINRMIRSLAQRVESGALDTSYLDLNYFIREELEFLKANLYFKHQVETKMMLFHKLAPIKELPAGTHLALRLLLHGMVELTETKGCKQFFVRTSQEDGYPALYIGISPYRDLRELSTLISLEPTSEVVTLGGENFGMSLAVILLKSSGAKMRCEQEEGTLWLSTVLSLPSPS